MHIPVREYNTRINQTRKMMGKHGLDALIIYANCKMPGNVQYLSNYAVMLGGYQSSGGYNTVRFGDTILVLPIDRDPIILTNTAWAVGYIRERTHLKNVEPTFDYAGAISKILRRRCKRIGINGLDIFPALTYERLKRRFPKTRFVESMIIEELRMLKSPAEIKLIQKAAKLAGKGIKAGIAMIKSGKTEIDVANAIENTFMTGNPYYMGYDTRWAGLSIIGSGSRTALEGVSPLPTLKKIKKGDLVVMDVIPEYDGYAGDISRAKVLGRPSKAQRDLFEAVMQMYKACRAKIRPGTKAKELQDTANCVARECGYKAVPLVSHGIGLEIHERPDAGVEETKLTANMVISCEPAVTTSKLGMRIEDTLLVTETGSKALTSYEKTLEI